MTDEFVYRAIGCSIEQVKCVKRNAATVDVEVKKLLIRRPDKHMGGVVESQVVVERHRRSGRNGDYFDTWAEARDFLLNFWEEEVGSCRVRLERAKGGLGNVKGLKPPKA